MVVESEPQNIWVLPNWNKTGFCNWDLDVEPNFVEKAKELKNVEGFLNTVLRITNRYMVISYVKFWQMWVKQNDTWKFITKESIENFFEMKENLNLSWKKRDKQRDTLESYLTEVWSEFCWEVKENRKMREKNCRSSEDYFLDVIIWANFGVCFLGEGEISEGLLPLPDVCDCVAKTKQNVSTKTTQSMCVWMCVW